MPTITRPLEEFSYLPLESKTTSCKQYQVAHKSRQEKAYRPKGLIGLKQALKSLGRQVFSDAIRFWTPERSIERTAGNGGVLWLRVGKWWGIGKEDLVQSAPGSGNLIMAVESKTRLTPLALD